jgi:hypothetical protein
MKGEISHLATDIRHTKKPVRLLFEAQKAERKVSGTIEFHPEGRFTLHFEASGFKVSGLEFKGKYVPRSVKADSLATTLDVEIEEGKTGGKISLALDGVKIETAFEGMDERIAAVLARVFAGIKKFSGEFAMDFDGSKLAAFSGRTDLADEVGKAFVDAFGAEVKDLKDKALDTLARESRGPEQEARDSAGKYRSSEGAQVGSLRKRLVSITASLSGDRQKHETAFADLEGKLSLSGDPKAAAEKQSTEIDSLAGRLTAARAKSSTDHQGQEKAAAELAESMKGEKGRMGTTEQELKAQMVRIRKLLQKVIG